MSAGAGGLNAKRAAGLQPPMAIEPRFAQSVWFFPDRLPLHDDGGREAVDYRLSES